MRKLFTYNVGWGRGFGIEGLFIATQKEVNNIIGKNIYFGEICGKHSEIEHTFEKNEIKEVKISEEAVLILESELGNPLSGHNPVEIYEDMEEQ